jgi:hypothetical protein
MSTHVKVPEHLVMKLADPFDVFPFMHALRGLGKVVEEYDDALFSQYEDLAPKYRDIGLEQGIEAVSIIVGAGFVAAQSILTNTFSSVQGLTELEVVRFAGGAGLPKAKRELFQIAAYDRGGVPDISGINALANYFKHASEWSYDWSALSRPLEVETVRIVRTLGLRPGDPDNMFRGAGTLSFGGRDGLSKLVERIQEWRESVEGEVRRRLIEARLLS